MGEFYGATGRCCINGFGVGLVSSSARVPGWGMTPNEYTFRYRVRNGPDGNRGLMARDRLTFGFDEEAISAWQNTEPRNGPGVPKVYSPTAIQCA